MVGTNVTFFPMILLGYAGMPRRYASYEVTVGPIELFAGLHQVATLGVVLLTFGRASSSSGTSSPRGWKASASRAVTHGTSTTTPPPPASGSGSSNSASWRWRTAATRMLGSRNGTTFCWSVQDRELPIRGQRDNCEHDSYHLESPRRAGVAIVSSSD